MYARVAILTERGALTETYTYQIPEQFFGVRPGACLLVPFQNMVRLGYLVEMLPEPDVPRVRAAIGRVEASDIPDERVKLARWMAKHWCAPVGSCLRLMMPPALRGRIQRRLRAICKHRPEGLRGTAADLLDLLIDSGPVSLAALTRKFGREAVHSAVTGLRKLGLISEEAEILHPGSSPKTERVYCVPDPMAARRWIDANRNRRPAQAALLTFLVELGTPISRAEILPQHPSAASRLGPLVDAGLVREELRRVLRRPAEEAARSQSRFALTYDQAQAVGSLENAIREGSFREILLFGVTASGKTEVYTRAIEAALSMGRGAIVLMPEIALTVHALAHFRGRFGDTLAVLHSRLSSGERADEWRRIERGEARVVLGPRSAVFAPLPDPGIFIIDEEHEPAFKQDGDPRYHARDVCRWLAERHRVPLLLGSATPAVETFRRAELGQVDLCELPGRVDSRPAPKVRVIDMREIARKGALHVLSDPLKEELLRNHREGGQAIVFLNRRAYGTFVLCRECGYVCVCPNCAVSTKHHREDQTVRCHHCGWRGPAPIQCPSCQGTKIASFGVGTQRVEEELQSLLPTARILRMDRDTTGGKDAFVSLIGRFRRHEADILIGTQMVAKGLDFPGVLLVGVINADTGLHMPDFRAAERGFQLLTQVAGRAGRGPRAGLVVLQTFQPEHYAIAAAVKQDYRAFYEQEIRFREELGWPPFGAIARVLVQDSSSERCRDRCRELAGKLEGHPGVEVLGPSAAPLERLKGRYRWHLLLRSYDRESILGVLESAGARAWKQDVQVDVDPVNLM
ncbi:MAG: primosomal protein N' [Armatimonadota bacterium]|nr:MAG: primosomal protein N' [Armatimonadota bacterium]